MKDTPFESQATFDEANATEWRDMLLREWSRPFVSLTSAAYFVASNGVPIEPDDDALEYAAHDIVRRLQDGKLIAFGKRDDGGSFERIPLDDIATATIDGSPLFEPPPLDAALHLSWAILPGGDEDLIETRAAVRWHAVSICRSDLDGLLSPAIVEPAQRRGEPVASDDDGKADKRPRGPLPKKLNQTVVAMLADFEAGFPLISALEKELSERYGASRDTCRKARKLAESEFVGVSPPTNDK
jgi:hypothetical protein